MEMKDLPATLLSKNLLSSPIQVYSFQKPRIQDFSIPFPTIKHICKNPSSGKAWKKLILTCKYFYSKNPVFPFYQLDTEWELAPYSFDKILIYEADYDDSFGPEDILPKLWLCGKLYLNSYCRELLDVLTILIPKITTFDLRAIDFVDFDIILNEFQIITASGTIKEMSLKGCIIYYDFVDYEVVTFDELFQNLQHIENVDIAIDYWRCEDVYQPDIVEGMAKVLLNLKKLRTFKMLELHEHFDVSLLSDYLLKNDQIDFEISYYCGVELYGQYLEAIENFIDKIVENPPKKIPDIEFYNFYGDRYEEYKKLR